MWKKEILLPDEVQPGFAGLVRAGPLLFTGGCDGHRGRDGASIVPELAGDAEAQCENAYGRIEGLLRRAGSDAQAIVRLDHATSSQDWLPRRQTVRQKFFGRPAPLASTGVAGRMAGLNMLTASAIAVADRAQKEVLVSGPRYGMHNISSAVRGGPFLFVSGVRGTLDPRSGQAVAEETADAFEAQVRLCWSIIGAILAEAGADLSQVIRVDSFIRERRRAPEADRLLEEAVGGAVPVRTTVALPLSARGEVEITVLAAAPGTPVERIAPDVIRAGGLHFIGQTQAPETGAGNALVELASALDALERKLQVAGTSLARIVRLDLFLDDIYFAAEAFELMRGRFGAHPPTVVVTGADLGQAEVRLGAVAV